MSLPVGVIQGVLSAVSGYLTRYVRPLLLSAAGILIMALSFWLASRFTLHTTHGHILFILYLRGFGMGLTFAPLNLFSLKNLTQQDMAAAAGISNSIKQLAGSIGIALLTVIFSARTSTTPHTRPSPRRRPTSKGSRTPCAWWRSSRWRRCFRCWGSSGKNGRERAE